MALVCLRQLSTSPAKNILRNAIQTRTVITTETGGILKEPSKKGITGFAGVALAVTTGITVGSIISKDVASFLEENDLFVPSDDEDD